MGSRIDGSSGPIIRPTSPREEIAAPVQQQKIADVQQQGWNARSGARRTAEPAVTQQTAAARGPVNAMQVYANARQSLDGLEFQLKGLAQPQREALFQALASRQPPPAGLEQVAETALGTLETMRTQMEQLPPEQAEQINQLLDQDKRWPMADVAFEAMQGPEQVPAQDPIEVYANARQSLNGLEQQLSRLSPQDRQQLNQSIAAGEQPPAHLQPAADAAVQAMMTMQQQIGALPPEQQQSVLDQLDKENAWPSSGPTLEAFSGAVQEELNRPNSTGAARTSAAVDRAIQDGQLEVRELGTVVRTMAEDMQAARTPREAAEAGDQAMQQMVRLMQSATIPVEQQAAFNQAIGQLQELASQGAGPDRVAALGRQLESMPPMRGVGLSQQPQTPMTPMLRDAVASTVRDGVMDMREFATVLRTLSHDVQRGTRDDDSAQQVYEQASAQMMFLTQNAKIQPGQEQTFLNAANEFGRLTQQGASPRDIERLANAIEQGYFGR